MQNVPSTPSRAAALATMLALAAPTVQGQSVDDRPIFEPGLSRAAAGLVEASHATLRVDEGLIGVGHAFKASFRPGGVEFLPALGAEAQRDFPLAFTLEEIRRGDTLVHAAAVGVEPSHSDDLVTYARGASIDERYEVSAQGLHQSFLFHEPLSGSGDLVVRGRLQSDLVPEVLADGSLFFRHDEGGGVRFGTVTGIDAGGTTAAGELCLVGSSLELVLPAAFVDGARYPLLLDPLIGTEIQVDDSTSSDSSPELAWGGSYYLAVWERTFSFNHQEIYAQRITSSGTLFGSTIPIVTGAGIAAREPAVGYVSSEGAFLVAIAYAPNFLVAPQIHAVNVAQANGSVTASVAVSASGNVQLSPRVGGDRTGTDNEAFVVWQESGLGVRGRTVTADSVAAPVPLGAAFTIDASTGTYDAVNPAISKRIYSGVDFLVAWQRVSTVGDRNYVYARMYSRNGTALTGVVTAHNIALYDHTRPDVDGDGDTFVMAWERTEGIGGPDHDIVCRTFQWNGSVLSAGVVRFVENDAGDDETLPSVAFCGSTAVVAYLDADAGGTTNCYVRNVDPWTGYSVGEQLLSSGANATKCAAANRLATDDVLVVWDDALDILGQRYDAVGETTSAGGGCGSGGLGMAPNAVADNADFRMHLRGATPGVLAACVIGQLTFPVGCGTCTLVPDLEYVYYDTTDANGNASVNVPIPANFGGQSLYSQWITFVPVGACPLAPLDFADARLTVFDSGS